MSRKICSFDASVLKINDDAPVKVTFLKSNGGDHFFGFYAMADGTFYDVRALFANTDGNALISGVSSVFLGSRLNGKTPVFFVIENGYALNKEEEWFADASAGHGGIWKFLKRPLSEDLTPSLAQGKIVWLNPDGEIAEEAQNADLSTPCPVLVWQSNGGRVYAVKGRIFHSFGYGLNAGLNPDGQYRFSVTPQEESAAVILDFDDVAAQRSELSFSLHLGERNLAALTRNRVITILPERVQIQTPVLSVTVEIPEDFDDTLYLEGFEQQRTIPAAGVTFLIEGLDTNRLTIRGEASLDVYESLLSRVKIRTAASAAAKSDVRIAFQTEKEELSVIGKADILSEKAQAASLLARLPLSKEENAFPITLFKEAEQQANGQKNPSADLPSFITQPVSMTPVIKTPANGKTVLITGGAGKRGAAVAHAFAASGYNVIIHCHTAVAQATHLVEELRQKYRIKASYFRADFNSYDETADLIPMVTKTYGFIDILVCHAFAFAKDETAQSWDENMAINLRAPFILMRSFAVSLPKGREGTVISVFSHSPNELSSYALTCSSLPELTSLAAQVYKNKIKVAGLEVSASPSDDAQNKKVAETICFMAQNPVVSGQILRLDPTGAAEKKTSLF